MGFVQNLQKNISKNNSLLCVGLDADKAKLPQSVLQLPLPQFAFNKAIIDATLQYVSCYKPNSAFYESCGKEGLESLEKTIEYLHQKDVPVVLDVKRGDIGNTAQQFAISAYDELGADSVTLNPYMGLDAIEPFLNYRDKYSFVLVKTSNSTSGDFQDLYVTSLPSISPVLGVFRAGEQENVYGVAVTTPSPLYMHVARKVLQWNELYNNCGMVVGATYPEQLAEIRALSEQSWILVPGIGKQGGDLEKTLKAGLNKDKEGLILVSAREIIFASSGGDFAEKAGEKAKETRDAINLYR
ncbi:MAG: orotidine-5'-phosphate decarboxylase [bacterium]